MEIKTCEQYVLAQLLEQQDENDRVEAENRRLREEVRELRAAAEESEASPMQRAIRETGRKELFSRCSGYSPDAKGADGEAKPFGDWCVDDVRGYRMPNGVTVLGFIEEFGPELRERYDTLLSDEED